MRAAAAEPTSRRPSTGRGCSFVVALALLATFAGSSASRAAESLVTVLLDRAEIMRLPAGTDAVVVGNPIIADVTLLRNTGQLILTGKGFGDTNLVFLDGHGGVVAEARLQVRESASMLVVQRGADRETYACTPRCQPTVSLGDSSAYMKMVIDNIDRRNFEASGAAAAAATSMPGAH